MASVLIETLGINKTEQVVISKTWRLQTNPHSGKTYRHTFQRKGRDVNKIYTRRPNEKTWDGYESRKDKFVDDLYEDLEYTSLKKKDKRDKERGKRNTTNIKKFTNQELDVHQKVNVQGLTQMETARLVGVSPSRVSVIVRNIYKKLNISKEKSLLDNIKPHTP